MFKKVSLILIAGLTLTSTIGTKSFASGPAVGPKTLEESNKEEKRVDGEVALGFLARKTAEKRHLELIRASLPGYLGRHSSHQPSENKGAEKEYAKQMEYASQELSREKLEMLKKENASLGDLGLLPREVRDTIFVGDHLNPRKFEHLAAKT